MSKCPEISTFRHNSGPAVVRWIARFVTSVKPPKGPAYFDFLPIEFRAASESEVVDKASSWWAEEQRKEQAKADRIEAAKRKTAEASP